MKLNHDSTSTRYHDNLSTHLLHRYTGSQVETVLMTTIMSFDHVTTMMSLCQISSFHCSFYAGAFVLSYDGYNFSPQILVALKLSDMVSVGRGNKARIFKKRIRMTFFVIFVIVNVPSLIGCWIAANTYCCPVCTGFAYISI